MRKLAGRSYSDLLGHLVLEHDSEHFSDLIPPLKRAALAVPPGHFYSPYPDISSVRSRWSRIFGASCQDLPGLREDVRNQLTLVALLEPLIRDFPYAPAPDGQTVLGMHDGRSLRYECSVRNTTFHLDAVLLQAMLRHFKPRRVIEVGSGYSSALMLDVREREGWAEQVLTFIEPYAQDYFYPLLHPDDSESTRILEQPLWEVDHSLFETLEAGDLLFIDSSHVAKVGSDVYHYLFEILPRLRPGVLVHIHDIAANYEMAPSWFENGWYWNEGAFLRAFLMFNDAFEILLHANLLHQCYPMAPGLDALVEQGEKTFVRPEWKWVNSFYFRRRPVPGD
ncbi:class I SAM-dependent methyltransferase [Thiocystis violacea]|uniref:class I SAM-dependent methyltransferase n=1 Tax=Thiocystis violacea TaxID=13725 RepID=UPI001908C5EE|nr:class I SAM-dependent methyltransferase [Thiocystis violacea]